MAGLVNQQKRQWAQSLYVNESRTQAEVADIVGVSRQTIVRWSKEDHWDEYKASLTMTREEQIKNLQHQIVEINRSISEKAPGKRFASPAEADIINKIASAINKLETDVGIADLVSAGQRFLAYLRPVDYEAAQKFARLYNNFIKSML